MQKNIRNIIIISGLALLSACSASDKIQDSSNFTQQETPSLDADPSPTSINVHFLQRPNDPAGISFQQSKEIGSFIRTNVPWSTSTIIIHGPSHRAEGNNNNVNIRRMSSLIRICELNGAPPNRIATAYAKNWSISIEDN